MPIKDHLLLCATAYWTAAVRARESARPDRLFSDPWAEALAGPVGLVWIEGRPPESVLPITLRTRFFDDYLMQVVTQADIRQVILMAAGLDTRAFRLAWPAGTRVFELDQARVLEYKQQSMSAAAAEPACQRYTIPADLTKAWEDDLIQAGYDPENPSVWLLEGFLFYLPCETLTSLLERVMAMATPGSYIGFDIINSFTLTSPYTKSWVEMQANCGAPWIGALDDPRAFLAQHGWQASLTPIGAPQANYGRYNLPVIPADAPGLPHFWFVTGQKG